MRFTFATADYAMVSYWAQVAPASPNAEMSAAFRQAEAEIVALARALDIDLSDPQDQRTLL